MSRLIFKMAQHLAIAMQVRKNCSVLNVWANLVTQRALPDMHCNSWCLMGSAMNYSDPPSPLPASRDVPFWLTGGRED